jgi:3-hydroxyacyl-[acyl-carrier-protein] dehydratase
MSTDSPAVPTAPDPSLPPLPWEAATIMEILPHRYPFLLIDRVVEIDPGQRVVAMRNVTANEPQFQGHFPGRPIMPGVLLVESLAQAGCVAVLSTPENRGKLVLFGGIDECKFRRIVVPGDTLRLEITVEKLGRVSGRARAVASVEGEVACEAYLTFIMPRDQDLGGSRAPGG